MDTSGNGQAHPAGKRLRHSLPPDTLEFLLRSLKKQWKYYRKQLRKCQREFSESSVHEVRVSARRLLSLLDLLAPFLAADRLKKAQGALKQHLDIFDDLRDTQVQLAAARQLRKEFPAAGCFYHFLKKCEARVSRSTCKKARKLRSKPLNKVMRAARDDVREWLREADSPQANPLLFGAVDSVFSLTRQRKDCIDSEDTHSIHCTRVAFKEFRYVIETLQDRLAWANETLLAKMHDYQTLMGDIQDAEVLLRGFQEFMRKKQPHLKPGLKFERALRERRQKRIRKFLAGANQLQEFWPLAAVSARSRRGTAAGNGRPDVRHTRGRTSSISQKKHL